MQTKDSARVFDVRLTNPSTRRSLQPSGEMKEFPYTQNIHLIVVAETVGRANDITLQQYPNAQIYQINNHGHPSRIVVDDALLTPG